MSYQKYFEMLWNGLCDIYEMQSVRDETTKLTTTKRVKVNEEPIKCKLLFKNFPETKDGVIHGVNQQVKLLIHPSIKIKEGSLIVVTQNNVTESYENSGKPATYRYHQEINLKASQEYV